MDKKAIMFVTIAVAVGALVFADDPLPPAIPTELDLNLLDSGSNINTGRLLTIDYLDGDSNQQSINSVNNSGGGENETVAWGIYEGKSNLYSLISAEDGTDIAITVEGYGTLVITADEGGYVSGDYNLTKLAITIVLPENDTILDDTPDYNFLTYDPADLWYSLDGGTNRVLENNQTGWSGTIYRDMLPADGDNYTQSTDDWAALVNCGGITLSSYSKIGTYSLNCTRSDSGNARMDYPPAYTWNENLSGYENMEFWAIADNATETLKFVHLHTGGASDYFRYARSYEYDLIQLSNTSWTRITIPFSNFTSIGSPSWEDIDRIMMSFRNGTTDESIFVDGLRFAGGNLTKDSHDLIVYANNTDGTSNLTRWFTVSNIAIASPQNTTISSTAPELNFTVGWTANTTYNWDGEGNISGCRNCDSYSTTYGESTPDADTALLIHFNENNGSTAYDDSSYENDGTIANAVYTAGKFGPALDFDGSGDYVEVQDSASLNFDRDDSFTMMGWIKIPAAPLSEAKFVVNTATGSGENYEGFHCFIPKKNGMLRCMLHTNSSSGTLSVLSAVPVNDSTWHHFAFVRNVSADEGYLYMDGVLDASADDNTNPNDDPTNTQNLFIGALNSGANFLDGTIDELHIVRRTLNATEIADIYNKTLSSGQHSVTVYATDVEDNQDNATRYFTTE